MDDLLRAEWSRKTWVESANDQRCGFPLQSLPYCVFQSEDRPRIGVGIGDFILDLSRCHEFLRDLPASIVRACNAPTLNALIGCGNESQALLRTRLKELLDSESNPRSRGQVKAALEPMRGTPLLKPVQPANYTDFYASIHHATRVGQLFRAEHPLLPNYKFVPIGYHGRASSIVVSGTPIRRPCGQTKPEHDAPPTFGPTQSLDYEVEVAIYVHGGNPLGSRISARQAVDQIFGFSLLNDWTARDIQAWEYQPLGPFLSKSFATSVSPWVIPSAALTAFRCAAQRPAGNPQPLDYLLNQEDQQEGAIDLTLEAYLLTPAMRNAALDPYPLSHANLRDLYWTPAQLVTHHTSNGCNLIAGDLLATGTVSGPEEQSAGCLLELTQGGRSPIVLPNGESRRALQDGDEVILRGVCRRDELPDVSLGECRGMVIAADSCC